MLSFVALLFEVPACLVALFHLNRGGLIGSKGMEKALSLLASSDHPGAFWGSTSSPSPTPSACQDHQLCHMQYVLCSCPKEMDASTERGWSVVMQCQRPPLWDISNSLAKWWIIVGTIEAWWYPLQVGWGLRDSRSHRPLTKARLSGVDREKKEGMSSAKQAGPATPGLTTI